MKNFQTGLVSISFHAVLSEEGSALTVKDPEGRSCTVRGPRPERARTVALTESALSDRLSKTGGTPYVCRQVTAEIDPGLTMSAANINALRRSALDQLTAIRARREKPQLNRPQKFAVMPGYREHPGLTVQVTSKEQITPKLLSMHLAALYVPLHILALDPIFCHELNRKIPVTAVLPRIVHDSEMNRLKDDLLLVKKMGVKDALVGNLGLLLPVREAGMKIRGDFGLNLYNS